MKYIIITFIFIFISIPAVCSENIVLNETVNIKNTNVIKKNDYFIGLWLGFGWTPTDRNIDLIFTPSVRAMYFFTNRFGLLFDISFPLPIRTKDFPFERLNYMYLSLFPVFQYKRFFVGPGIILSVLLKAKYDIPDFDEDDKDIFEYFRKTLLCLGIIAGFYWEKKVKFGISLDIKFSLASRSKSSYSNIFYDDYSIAGKLFIINLSFGIGF